MSETLTPKELAAAAAQGVAIALNARKPKSGVKEEFLLPHRIIVCGIPPALFDVHLVADQAGQVTAGTMTQRQTEA